MSIKVLIVRFSSIGDIVLTSPMVRCLKQQVPGIEIHYLTKKSFSSILNSNPFIDKVYTINKEIAEVTKELKAEQYGYIIDLHHNIRTLKLKLLLRKPTVSFNKLNFQKWLLVNLKINRLPQRHIVDRYFDTVSFLSIINDGKGLDYFIPPADEVDVFTLPVSHKGGYIGFAIGAQLNTKKLPLEKIINVVRCASGPVVLLGGPEDAEIGEKVKKAIGDKVYNACGKYNLNQSASLVKQAKRIIAHDTGLMHIAAAFKKQITSVWGNTVPEFGMYPYLPGEGSKIIEIKNLYCRPCSKIGYKRCPLKHFKCMNLHNEEQIAN